MAAEGSLKIRLQLSAWRQAYGLRGPFRRVRQKIPVALDFTACRANCPNIVFFDMADWVLNPAEGPISWPAKYTWKGWESIMDQVGTEYSEQYKPLMKRAGSMEKALEALLAVIPGRMLRKLELQDCISKRGDRYQLDLKLRERQ